jgi:hypothetical protein
MHWINVVWILAAALSAAAMALFAFVLGAGWYGLIAGPPIFVIVSVLLPFFLGVLDRKREAAVKRDQSKPSRFIGRPPIGTRTKKSTNQPAPAVANAMKASWAESAGRGPTGHSPLPLLRPAAERESRGSPPSPAGV